MAEHVTLRDGTDAWVWPLLPSDRERLADEFEKLSPESRRRRFLTPMARLSEQMLDHLVDGVDGVDHIALVLLAELEDGTFDPVGIARIVRYDDVPDAADLAVTVKDDWQGRGVATKLLEVLVAQRPAGVTHILTEVACDNPSSIAMLERLGPTRLHANGYGAWDVEVDLCERGPHPETTEDAPRLHPVLAETERAFLRGRDLICSLLNND